MYFGSEMVNNSSTKIIRNDQRPPPNFKNTVNINTPIDDVGELSSISPRVLIVQDIKSCYQCKIEEIGYFKIRPSYDKL